MGGELVRVFLRVGGGAVEAGRDGSEVARDVGEVGRERVGNEALRERVVTQS